MSENVNDCLADYPVVISVPVLWGDEDSFGHVNNIVYLRWCESARVEYLRRIGLWGARWGQGVGPILANISCDYKKPVTYPDTVRVGARVVKVGNRSFRMDHVVVSEQMQTVVATVESTIVAVDYTREETVRVPDTVRKEIARLEDEALVEPA